MYAQAYGGQAPSFFHREVYNLIMEAREILTKFKNNEISLEEGTGLDAIGVKMIKSKAKEFFYRRYAGFNTLVVRV